MKSCGLVASALLTEQSMLSWHALLLLGRLGSVFSIETREYSSVISSLLHYLSAVLDTWMAKQKKSNLREKVHVMKSFFTKTIYEAQKEVENAKTHPNTNQESWKIF